MPRAPTARKLLAVEMAGCALTHVPVAGAGGVPLAFEERRKMGSRHGRRLSVGGGSLRGSGPHGSRRARRLVGRPCPVPRSAGGLSLTVMCRAACWKRTGDPPAVQSPAALVHSSPCRHAASVARARQAHAQEPPPRGRTFGAHADDSTVVRRLTGRPDGAAVGVPQVWTLVIVRGRRPAGASGARAARGRQGFVGAGRRACAQTRTRAAAPSTCRRALGGAAAAAVGGGGGGTGGHRRPGLGRRPYRSGGHLRP
jgi:hypothetical protein